MAQTSRSNCQQLDKWLWDPRTGDLRLAASVLTVGSQCDLCVAQARGVDEFLCFSSPQPSCCPSHTARLLILVLHWTWAAGQKQLLPASRVPNVRVQWPGGDEEPGAPPCHGVEEQQLAWGPSGQSDLSHQSCAVRAHFGSLNNWVGACIPWCSASRWLQA